MVTIIGRQIEAGIAKETSRGTAKTTADRWMRKVVANIIPRAEKVIDDSTRGRFEDAEGQRTVKNWYEGDLEGIVHGDVLGYLLLNLYGSVSSAVATGTAYNHTFSLQQGAQHNSMTLFIKDASVVQEVIANCMLSSLELNASVDDYVRFKAAFLGGAATSNASSPSYGTEYDFIGKDITVKVAATEGGISGASALPVKSISITWDQGLIANHVFGAYTPSDIHNTKLSIEGTMTLDYGDTTFRDLWTADTTRYLSIVIEGAATIGTSSKPKINILLNKAAITDWSRSAGNDDIATQEVSFKAFYQPADTESSSVILTNLLSSI
jgi:hypothetical protein